MPGSPQKLILVVEDDPQQRTLYARVLAMGGYGVAEAGTAEEAVAQARRLLPDLVLMDVTLPGASGWAATRELKSHPDTRCIAVLVVSGRASLADRDESVASGSDAFLGKPVLPRRLLEEVGRLLGREG